MSRALRTVADYAQKRIQFDSHASYREMLGVHFQGVQSPWDDLDGVLVWYERIFVALPEHQAHSEPFRQSGVYREKRPPEGNQSQSHLYRGTSCGA